MTRRRAATLALLVASAVALGAGVVPSVHEAVAVRADSAVAPAHLESTAGPVPGLRTGTIRVPDLGGGAHRVRVGVVEPPGEPVADVLFLHGHADRLDNHAALTTALARAGVRVVSFDLPSHGRTDAGAIDRWSFDDLAALAGRVLRATGTDTDRPLVLAGWSFGGLLASRIVQDPGRAAALGRPVRGLVLESPAVVPSLFPGGDGVSRLRALTHDLHAPVAGRPDPASPFTDPVFAGRLVAQAQVARVTPLPAGLPTLVELGGDHEDRYVDVPAVRAWAEEVAPRDGAPVRVVSCAGGRHALDLEAWPVGVAARSAIVDFVRSAVDAGPVRHGHVGSVRSVDADADADADADTVTDTDTDTEEAAGCR